MTFIGLRKQLMSVLSSDNKPAIIKAIKPKTTNARNYQGRKRNRGRNMKIEWVRVHDRNAGNQRVDEP